MITGILSDIHGNAEALKRVLAEAEKNKVEKLLILGDCVGYYYDAIEVFDMLGKWDCEYIKGNHENILINYLTADSSYRSTIRSKYGSAFELCLDIGENKINFIKELPEKLFLTLDGLNILIAHGSPTNTDEYIYPDTSKEKFQTIIDENFDFIFLGHTHYPMNITLKKTNIINPGSVGQSRVCGGIANWGILNTTNRVYKPMATPYDVSALIKQAKSIDPGIPYLHEILLRNNKTSEE